MYKTITLMKDPSPEKTVLMNRICRNLVGKKPSKIRHSNENIMCFCYRNHTIKKSTIIYTYMTRIFMKDPTWKKNWRKESASIYLVKNQAKLDNKTWISLAYVSKSGESKIQSHLYVHDYNFHKGSIAWENSYREKNLLQFVGSKTNKTRQ